MATINREGLVRRLNDKMGEGLAKSNIIIDNFVETLIDIMKEGHDIRLQGFGMFRLKHIKERKINIPVKDANSSIVPAHTGVQFKLSNKLKDELKDIKISPY